MNKIPLVLIVACGLFFYSFSPLALAESQSEKRGNVSVMTVVTKDPGTSFYSRLTAARNLSEYLNRSSINVLFSFLDRYNSDDYLPSGKLNALKNDVANAILAQATPAQGFGEHLIDMHNDPKHDAVWRDYCIQFLGDWHPRADRESRREEIRETLWDAASRDWTIAGTALISLYRVENSIDRSRLAKKAYQIASSSESSSASRTTALQICATTGHEKALPLARDIAHSDAEIPLRVSALGAIGILGDSSDGDILKKYVKSAETRLRHAASAAIERIRRRFE